MFSTSQMIGYAVAAMAVTGFCMSFFMASAKAASRVRIAAIVVFFAAPFAAILFYVP